MRSVTTMTLIAAFGLTVAAQTPALPDRPPTGNAENGKKLFAQYGCYQCHGYAAQGGVGARLAPNPIPFSAFTRYIRQPKGQMPPYTTKVVTDSELADIYAFLRSLPKPPDAKSIPLLHD